MKCNILAHEFNTSSNGNLYCKLEVKPANDEWAQSFNYVMFVTEAMQEALEKNFPKFIFLKEERVQTPEPFYRVWMSSDNNHEEGSIVSRVDRTTGEIIPIVFNDIKVVIRTLPDGTPARGEDAEKLCMSNWNRGISDGSIVPLSAYYEGGIDNNIAQSGGDAFAGAESAPEGTADTSEPEQEQEVQPTQNTQPTKPRLGRVINRR